MARRRQRKKKTTSARPVLVVLRGGPSDSTLERYGLTRSEWQVMYDVYNGRCHVCREPPKGYLCIDHEHVKGWRKMAPADRKRYVRGLLCFYCNYRRVGRGINLLMATRMVEYLTTYEQRSNRATA